MKVVVASPGTGVFVQETTNAYREQEMLETFFTSFVANIDLPGYRWLHGTGLGRQMARREIAKDLLPYVSTRPLPELLRTLSSRLLPAVWTDWAWEASERSFDKWVAAHLHVGTDVLHCYEHCSLHMMERAQELGLFVVYEQPSQHHSFLTPVISEQLAQFPELANDAALMQVDQRAAARNARRDAELALADMILCNSDFTRRTLRAAGVPPHKIQVVPLGFPVPVAPVRRRSDKLRFLYAGTSSIRKGVHLLLQAWRALFSGRTDVELLVVGKFELASSCLEGLPANVCISSSIPRSELLKRFCDVDVLVLPTLADGFGMVISEAMSRGVCVMCTFNSAGPDIITHGHDGLLFNAGDLGALQSMLAEWVDRREELRTIGGRAIQTAARYQWHDYRKRLVNVVAEAMAPSALDA